MRRALTLGCWLWCGAASARTGVSWEYSAPPECPNEPDFRAQVEARLLRDRTESETSDTPSRQDGVHVEIRLEPSEQRGSLRLDEPGAPVVERIVHGDSCAELASGLALITALAFGAPAEPGGAPPTETATNQAQPLSGPAPGSAPPAPPPVTTAVTSDPRDSSAAQASASVSPELALQLGAGGLFQSFWAPEGGPILDVFLRLAPKTPRAWSLRLAGLYGTRTWSLEDRRAEFSLLGARAEGCPISRRLPLVLSAEACAALDLGELRGRGDASSALLEGESRTMFWAAAVLSGRLRARLAERVLLEAQAEVDVPLVRREFVFEEPQERIFRIPALGWGAGAGLAFEIL